MMRLRHVVPVVVVGWLVAVGLGPTSRAADPAGGVRDGAKFFSANAIEKADQGIREIKQQYKIDLIIETIPSIPDNEKDRLKRLGKEKFFDEWAVERTKAEQLRGIYVLICKNPSHFEVKVDKQTREKAFTLKDRDRLIAEALLPELKKRDFDGALLQTVQFVRDTLARNLGTTAKTTPTPTPAPKPALTPTPAPQPRAATRPTPAVTPSGGMGLFGWICIGLVALLVLWVVVGLIRSFTNRGTPPGYAGQPPPGYAGQPGAARPPGPGYGPSQGQAPGYGGAPGYGAYGAPPAGGGGGGFMTGLLGGMLGGAAGSWAYNRFFGGGGSPMGGGFGGSHAYGAGPSAAPSYSPPPAAPQQDSDYTGSGGDTADAPAGGGGADFGDTSGGGGGGDFGGDTGGGGGDWGGDSGGGGGDSGGGGDTGGSGGDFGGDSGGGGGDWGGGGDSGGGGGDSGGGGGDSGGGGGDF